MTRHKHADLIHAWAEGAEIEYQSASGNWNKIAFPQWDGDWKYRIKPKTVKKEGWVNVYTEFSEGLIVAHTGGPVYRTKKTADLSNQGNRVACIRIEWEEEI